MDPSLQIKEKGREPIGYGDRPEQYIDYDDLPRKTH